MSSVTSQLSISLDGFVAGPMQSGQDPIGQGGLRLHEWVFATPAWQAQQGLPAATAAAEPDREHDEDRTDNPDDAVAAQLMRGIGAFIMGRNMFGGGPGAWDPEWTGWWGDDPPYHAPVFVLSHELREPLIMHGGTTFTFVSDGVQSALQQAQAAAGELDVCVAGGASTVQQFLNAGLLDELHLHIVPVLLGAGERLFDGVRTDLRWQITSTVASPAATHVRYRVRR